MRALILGGHGLLGREVVRHWSARGASFAAPPRSEADLLRPEPLRRLALDLRPDWIVNCAAFTRVDDCEARPDDAMAINGEAVGDLAAIAGESGARLLQVSTDYVFDGRGERPYREDDPVAPASVYGSSKRRGEERALEHPAARALVVRVSWLFGPHGASFPRSILGQVEARRQQAGAGGAPAPLRVVADQIGCPTWAPFVARALWDLAAAGAAGIVHYRNREAISWHGYALAIAERWGAAGIDILPVTSAEFPRPARRPAYSVLDVARFEQLAGRPVEPWSAGLDEFLAQPEHRPAADPSRARRSPPVDAGRAITR